MNFNKHSDLAGQHAFLSASKYPWINYDDEKLANTYRLSLAAQKGTRLHFLASEAIDMGIKLPRSSKTLNMFVNDAIGYQMSPEVVLYYSPYAFGTADAIGFKRNKLRIHDLKTGTNRVSFSQLEVYAALFCMEYQFKPHELDEIELRIYQNDDIMVEIPDADRIVHIISRILEAHRIIREIDKETI